ncbi:hypothetical protein PYCCODRAFT_1202215 [Trametes coccinea BRFM310]|uniref:Uncharacterized protein n=1 Tax=Trametes coccinea (strain BRFM310) TaxID=1353009 RepID=A0A1Y2I972_TRAC3|nr:hypothetical protein PYCCODRAFT_1202215 [Trametes coccinea BRFM310]
MLSYHMSLVSRLSMRITLAANPSWEARLTTTRCTCSPIIVVQEPLLAESRSGGPLVILGQYAHAVESTVPLYTSLARRTTAQAYPFPLRVASPSRLSLPPPIPCLSRTPDPAHSQRIVSASIRTRNPRTSTDAYVTASTTNRVCSARVCADLRCTVIVHACGPDPLVRTIDSLRSCWSRWLFVSRRHRHRLRAQTTQHAFSPIVDERGSWSGSCSPPLDAQDVGLGESCLRLDSATHQPTLEGQWQLKRLILIYRMCVPISTSLVWPCMTVSLLSYIMMYLGYYVPSAGSVLHQLGHRFPHTTHNKLAASCSTTTLTDLDTLLCLPPWLSVCHMSHGAKDLTGGFSTSEDVLQTTRTCQRRDRHPSAHAAIGHPPMGPRLLHAPANSSDSARLQGTATFGGMHPECAQVELGCMYTLGSSGRTAPHSEMRTCTSLSSHRPVRGHGAVISMINSRDDQEARWQG